MYVDGQFRFLNFEVYCPRDPDTIRKMQLSQMWSDERWLPRPCNGCEEFNGAEDCDKCILEITLMFIDNPDMDLYKPIIPKRN